MRVGDRLRSTVDGQLGFADRDEAGKLVVRLDRPAEKRTVPYRASGWAVEAEAKLTPMQIARICYAADAETRAVLGEYSIPGWIALKDQQRQVLLLGPPKDANGLRKKVYAALKAVLG